MPPIAFVMGVLCDIGYRCDMTELDAVREPGPRDEGIVKWLAGGFDSLWGYLLYTVMWFGLSVAFVAIVPDLVVPKTLAHDHFGVVLLASFVIPWVPFFIWVRRRRASIRRLFRNGVLHDARITNVTYRTKRGVDGTEVRISFDDGTQRRVSRVFLFGHYAELAVGGTMPLLYEPSCGYVAAFPMDGAPVAATSTREG